MHVRLSGGLAVWPGWDSRYASHFFPGFPFLPPAYPRPPLKAQLIAGGSRSPKDPPSGERRPGPRLPPLGLPGLWFFSFSRPQSPHCEQEFCVGNCSWVRECCARAIDLKLLSAVLSFMNQNRFKVTSIKR